MKRLTLTALIAFTLDQAAKLLMIRVLLLPVRGEIYVLDPVLVLRWAENRGVNFGLFANRTDITRWVLIAVALAISAWVIRWIVATRQGAWVQIAGGLLVGGAMGNVVDRLAYGYVADFLNMSCCGIENPYSFNTADIFVFFGVAGIILFAREGGGQSPRRRAGRGKTS